MSKKRHHRDEWGYNQESAIDDFDAMYIDGTKPISEDRTPKGKKTGYEFDKELETIICGDKAEEEKPQPKKIEMPIIKSNGKVINQPEKEEESEEEETFEDLIGMSEEDEDESDSINAMPCVILTDLLNEKYQKLDYFDGLVHTYIDVESNLVQDIFLIDEPLDAEMIGDSLVQMYLALIGSSYPTAIFTKSQFDADFGIIDSYNKSQFVFFKSEDQDYVFAYEVDPEFMETFYRITNEDPASTLSLLGALNYVKRNTACFIPEFTERVDAIYHSDENKKAQDDFLEDFKNEGVLEKGDSYPIIRINEEVDRDYKETSEKIFTNLIFNNNDDEDEDDEDEEDQRDIDEVMEENDDNEDSTENDEEFGDLMDDVDESEKKPEHEATVMYKGE